jgi:hypothetical protein
MEDESAKEQDRNLRNALRRLLERYIQLARRRKQAAEKKKRPDSKADALSVLYPSSYAPVRRSSTRRFCAN